MASRMNVGAVFGFVLGALLMYQPPTAPRTCPPMSTWDCGESMAGAYEENISALLEYMRECRDRFGGCEPGSTWVWDEIRRRELEADPELAAREAAREAEWQEFLRSRFPVDPE